MSMGFEVVNVVHDSGEMRLVDLQQAGVYDHGDALAEARVRLNRQMADAEEEIFRASTTPSGARRQAELHAAVMRDTMTEGIVEERTIARLYTTSFIADIADLREVSYDTLTRAKHELPGIKSLSPLIRNVEACYLAEDHSVAFGVGINHPVTDSWREDIRQYKAALLSVCIYFAKRGVPCKVTDPATGSSKVSLQSFANDLQGLTPVQPRVIAGAKQKTTTPRLSSTSRRRTLLLLKSNRSNRNGTD
jgi:hypothetical protein